MKEFTLTKHVTRLLILLGFSPRHYGFSCLRDMILLGYDGTAKLTDMYPKIAAKEQRQVVAIQTAVRNALKNAQAQTGFKNLGPLLGVDNVVSDYPVPVKEFLNMILEYLKYMWDGIA